MSGDPSGGSRYAAMRWNTPLSEAHADTLIAQLDTRPGETVLDLGCGWGELLARVVAAGDRTVTGIGVGQDAALLTRGRTALAARGLQDRVRLTDGDATGWTEPSDVVLSIGAAHAWGGAHAALEALGGLVAPGGRLLFGDGCWEHHPSPHAAALFDDVRSLPELTQSAVAAGWRVLHLSTADQREWDEFESSWSLGRELWLEAHPGAPGAVALRRELDERLQEYLTVYRGTLGFAYLVLGRANGCER